MGLQDARYNILDHVVGLTYTNTETDNFVGFTDTNTVTYHFVGFTDTNTEIILLVLQIQIQTDHFVSLTDTNTDAENDVAPLVYI